MFNLVLFGPPGSGKGTQSENIISKFGLQHLSTGDLLRAEKKAETPLGLEAKKFMDNGELVPDEVVIGMISSKLDNSPDAKGFIFDGFPRTESQAISLDAFLSEKGEQINGMVALEVPENLLVERLLERGKTSGRTDDTDESKIRNRFNEYNTKTAILKDYYEAQGNYYGIDGVGSIEDITHRLCEVFDKL